VNTVDTKPETTCPNDGLPLTVERWSSGFRETCYRCGYSSTAFFLRPEPATDAQAVRA